MPLTGRRSEVVGWITAHLGKVRRCALVRSSWDYQVLKL